MPVFGKRAAAVATLLLLLILPQVAESQQSRAKPVDPLIPGLHNTGVDDDDKKLKAGDSDFHFEVIEGPVLGTPVVIGASDIPDDWINRQDSSLWISIADDTYAPAGTYVYRMEIDLTGFDPNSIVIEGIWGVDDAGAAIQLNGQDTGIVNSVGPGEYSELVLNDGFVDGINTIDFIVPNLGGASRGNGNGNGGGGNSGGGGGDDGLTTGLRFQLGNVFAEPAELDLAINKSHDDDFTPGGTGVYTLEVGNVGSVDSDTEVMVTDTLPTGLTPTDASGSGWMCGISGQTVTCSRADALAAGSAYPPIDITVDVAQDATSVTNTAVLVLEGDVNLSNNEAEDPTTIVQLVDLAILKRHEETFEQGQLGQWQIGVGNVGTTPSMGTVTVEDTVPGGFTPIDASGDGWTCSIAGQLVSCSRGDSLAPGEAYPVILLTVDVADDATSATNTAVVSGGADGNEDNNTATDLTPVETALRDLAIDKSHSGTFTAGDSGRTFTVTVSNVGDVASEGLVTVSDNLPAGLLPTAAAGNGWTCSIGGSLVECSRADALAAGDDYPDITITVDVAADATSTVNTAVVAGGGDQDDINNEADDPVVIEALPDPADLTIRKSHRGSFTQGATGTYTVTVSNVGGSPTMGQVNVSDTLPTGFAPTAAAGSGWSCSIAGQAVTCTRNDSLAAGDSYPDITIDVAVADDATSATNTASVAGGGEEDTSNNTDSDPTDVIEPFRDLAVDKSHSGAFVQGSTGSFQVVVANVGDADSMGTVTVNDTLPSGLAPTAATGNGWTCSISGATVQCSRGDTLGPGQAFPTITIDVAIALDATSVVNTVTIEGGGDQEPINNVAEDPVTIEELPDPADLTIRKSHRLDFEQGATGTYRIEVSNVGESPTSGAVTVADTLPAGFTPSNAAGDGWSCSIAGQAVTCTRSDSLAAGASFPIINLEVAVADDATSATNTATVSGGGEENTGNNSDSDPTDVIVPKRDLAIGKTHSGAFVAGQSGAFALTVINVGEGNSAGTVSVSDSFPAGLTPTSAQGDGWTCNIAGAAVECSRSDALAPGATYPAINVAVAVAADAQSNTNVATLNGGGDQNPVNNRAEDPYTVIVVGPDPVPDLSITKRHTGFPEQGQNNFPFTITVSNQGAAATTGTVTVVDDFPAGLIPADASGDGWSCDESGSNVSCTRNDALDAGASFPPITVLTDVADDATSTVNVATVSGGGDTSSGNNRAVDPVIIRSNDPDLTISKSHSGVFTQGQTGAMFIVAVTNVGDAATDGEVTVSDTLPAGLAPTGADGNGWSCDISGQVVTCERSDALAAAASFPPINLTVDVAADATDTINTATVAGGNDVNSSNNTADDPVTIVSSGPLLVPDLAIEKSHTGRAEQGQSGFPFTIVVRNDGGGDTVGEVVVDDPLPAGFSPTAADGSGWDCSVSGNTANCTRSDVLAPGNAYPAITITTDVAADASSALNIATVSGGGDADATNNTAKDPVLVASNDPDLSISKSHTGNFAQGQSGATFTIGVDNVGDRASDGPVTVRDTLPAGLTPTAATGGGWSCDFSGASVTCDRSDSLAPGASYPDITLTVDVAADATDTVNTATVEGGGDVFDGNNSADDPVTIGEVVETSADLAITKSHTGNVSQGQIGVPFTITVSNVGVAATSGTVTVSDPMPAGLTATAADGAGWSCSVGGTVSCSRDDSLASNAAYPPITITADIAGDATSTTNVATVSGGGDSNPTNNVARDAIVISGTSPDLTISKQHTGIFQQGQRHEFLIDVRNVGSAATSGNVTVSDNLPAGLSPADAAGDGWTCDATSNPVSCSRADSLAVGAAYPTITLGVLVSESAEPATNIAVVTGGGDSTPGNNTASDNYAVSGRADLTISKSHQGNFSRGQQDAEYTIVVRNAGNAPTSGTVTVVDVVPAGLTATSASGQGWTCSVDSPSVRCTRSDVLAARQSWPAISLLVNVSLDASNLVNTATVGGGGDVTPENNTASDPTTIISGPQLTITKTHPAPVVQGQELLTFTITAANNGDSATTGQVTVTDTLPPGLTPLSVYGDGWTCDLEPTTTSCSRSDRLPPGQVYPSIQLDTAVAADATTSVNTATVSGGGDTTPEDNTALDQVAIAAPGVPNLVIDKSHTGTFQQGQSGAAFLIEVANRGSVATSGPVTVADVLPAGVVPTSATGDGWTCTIAGQAVDCGRSDSLAADSTWPTIVIAVTVAPDAPSTIVNTATVSGGGDDTPEDNSDTDTVTIGGSAPDLTIDKRHNDPFSVGQSDAFYQIEVSNVGSLPSFGEVVVVDRAPSGFQPASAEGDGWDCEVAGQTATCRRSDSLAPGDSFPIIDLRVNVLPGATSGTNVVIVGGGGDGNPDNNVDQDATSVGAPPDLTIEMFPESDVIIGGETDYSATVTNVGNGTSVGPVVVLSDLSPTVTPLLAIGSGWQCGIEGRQFRCATTASVAPEEELPPLQFRVGISSNPAPELAALGRVLSVVDANPDNNSDELRTTIEEPEGDLQIVQESIPGVTEIGGEVEFVIAVRNRGSGRITGTLVMDVLPRGFVFVEGSAQSRSSLNRVNLARTSSIVLDEVDDGLAWRLGVMEPGETVLLAFRTIVGAEARVGVYNAEASVIGRGPDGDEVSDGPALAPVRIVDDAFSMQQVVVGRVFEDLDYDGTFGEGDRGVGGVRVITSTGQAVITDPFGLFNLPSVGSGSVALSIDPGTVPSHLTIADDGPGGGSWSRLLRTPVGGGALLRQDFRLVTRADANGNPVQPAASFNSAPSAAGAEGISGTPETGASRAADVGGPSPADQAGVSADADQDTTGADGPTPLSEIDRIWPNHRQQLAGGATPGVPPRREYETRQGPAMMIGFGEVAIGNAAPEFELFEETGDAWGFASLFYQGGFFSEDNRITLSYDSRRNLNNTTGADRLFELDALDRLYPVMGDTSTRQEFAQSNSDLFLRIERGTSYVMYGDLIGDLPEANNGGGRMSAYSRHLTGVEVRVGSEANYFAVRGANPTTSYARDVYPGSVFGLTLTHDDVLAGSETIALEIRDRRAPERILSRQVLARNVDYTLDATLGVVEFLRDVGSLDGDMNLIQVVATYEYYGRGTENMVYGGRASGTYGAFTVGGSFFTEEPEGLDRFSVGGVDVAVALPNAGSLRLDVPYSNGSPTVSSSYDNRRTRTGDDADGFAVSAEFDQPISDSVAVRASFLNADQSYVNPFAVSTTPGARYGRAEVQLDPFDSSRLLLGYTNERNNTDRVDNERNTVSAAWTQRVARKLFLTGGYDFRQLDDNREATEVESGLVTAEARVDFNRFEAMVRREQNVGDADDPTYPTQTVLGARYRLTPQTSVVYSHRLSDRAIVPVGDFGGFSSLDTKSELNIGLESRLRNGVRLTSRYQIEGGINGPDSFAVIGAQNRFDVGRGFAVDLGLERGQAVEGEDTSFTNGLVGIGWLAPDTFKVNARYQMRDRDGYTGLLSGAAAGRITSGLTGLIRGQWVDGDSGVGRDRVGYDVLAGLALRPLASDAVGLLFSYRLRDAERATPLLDIFTQNARQQRLSTDAYWRPLGWLELYGKGAWQETKGSLAEFPIDTYLGQGRVQFRLHRWIDAALEQRWLYQPETDSTRSSAAAELGIWPIADLRLGLGYSFKDTTDPFGRDNQGRTQGVYFTISTKLANLFDLLGSAPAPAYDPNSQ